MSQIVLMLAVVGVFYFFMMRPQQKKAKELKRFRENLAAGDKIVTIGGIHGKVLEVSDDNVLISCEGSSKLRVEKSAVSTGAENQLAAAQK